MTFLTTIYDVDFAELYRQHKQQTGRAPSTVTKWDHKAQQQPVGQLADNYSHAFIGAMQLQATDTVLDVGCGTGAIAVLVAAAVKQVYALDYSPKMLEKVQLNAQHYNAHNISTLCKSWEDSWAQIPVCDVVVASRSTLVMDMEQALIKLTQQAKRHVYITYPASTRFATAQHINAQEQPHLATPSYLYILAILHQLGLQPQLRYISNSHPQVGAYSDAQWAFIDWAVPSKAE